MLKFHEGSAQFGSFRLVLVDHVLQSFDRLQLGHPHSTLLLSGHCKANESHIAKHFSHNPDRIALSDVQLQEIPFEKNPIGVIPRIPTFSPLWIAIWLITKVLNYTRAWEKAQCEENWPMCSLSCLCNIWFSRPSFSDAWRSLATAILTYFPLSAKNWNSTFFYESTIWKIPKNPTVPFWIPFSNRSLWKSDFVQLR